jgi:ElaB/YqjD/DUF883 family membrane-anchored ribosome-binding protein
MATTRRTAKAKIEADLADMEATKRSLEEDVAQLRKDLAKLAEQFAKTGQHSYDAARRAATEGVEQLKTQGGAAFGDFKAGAENLEAQLTEAVREKPVTSLAIAAGVGFLFALLSRR